MSSTKKDKAKPITIEDIKAVDAFLAKEPIPNAAPTIIDITKYVPREIVDKDAELANNLRERQRGTGIYNYDVVWLLAVAHECHLGMTDVAQVLNALIIVSEKVSEREKLQL